ncbi:hypothetical protein [Mycobacterium sp. RTGN5]|uniref:hypothetical protein n=1 Tax=Mycobacterium sp. RTGN5 TaxID=3016522 RepID=UPI0029C90466|nr:hypothetical protein [Mycobacterium sp. RTGN5]
MKVIANALSAGFHLIAQLSLTSAGGTRPRQASRENAREAVSTIKRGADARDQITGISTIKPSTLVRSSIKIRTATDEFDDPPGFFEDDTVAHCGPTLTGALRPDSQPHRHAHLLRFHPHRAQ